MTKLDYDGGRAEIPSAEAEAVVASILERLRCTDSVTASVAAHLVDTSLCGVESHGVVRILQYADQIQTGRLDSKANPKVDTNSAGEFVDGDGGIGIPAMEITYQIGMEQARRQGISAVPVLNVGHTGKLRAFADQAAEKRFMTISIGGGNRNQWRQVAPHGGVKPVLPTNPWCIGMPGGDYCPVVVNFATSKIAGGWIYTAKSAGACLPQDCVIDKNGNPTIDPDDYFNGGAILPFGEHKGFSLSVIAELVAETMLGPAPTECNWLIITLDSERFRSPSHFRSSAESILAELRNCPTSAEFGQVEVPGERERLHRQKMNGTVSLPKQTSNPILKLFNS